MLKKWINVTLCLTALMSLSACNSAEDSSVLESNEEGQASVPQEAETGKDRMIKALPENSHWTDWNLLLVNNDNPLPESYDEKTPMQPAANGLLMDERIIQAWENWAQAAREAGHELVLISAYRSVAHQESIVDNTLQANLNVGYSEEEAKEKTFEYLTVPGCSEHHTGLALDLVDTDWLAQTPDPLIPEYDTHPSQHFLMETMNDYGFILRYPKSKENITGIQYESWHFRYVGEENARFITEHDLSLEEYIELLKERDEAEK